LAADSELNTISIRKAIFARVARDNLEYYRSVSQTEELLSKLMAKGADVFTFIERKWCSPIQNPSANWAKAEDNLGLLEIKDYATWFNAIGKKTRNMVRKAEKEGVKVSVVTPDGKFAEGVWKIYNETPIRQERAFPHFGESLALVSGNIESQKNSTFIGAYLEGDLIGFIQVEHGECIAILSNILSMQKHWDKSVNNAMLAKAVEVCASKGEHWLMYGRIGNHPSLDKFKENNGFVKYPITRYYIALTSKGRWAIKLGLHRELKDVLPEWLKKPLLPVESWISRNKVKLKMKLRKRGS
jgi:hypothetical protein